MDFRGIQPSRSSGEDKPPRTVNIKVDREKVALEVV
jgi:hypothetical protein